MRVLLTVVLFAGIVTSAAVASERIGGQRLRPQDPRVGLVIQEGVARSETFRALDKVADEKSLTALYRRIGQPSKAAGPLGWETIAAQRMGRQVRRELVAAPTMIMARASDNRPS